MLWDQAGRFRRVTKEGMRKLRIGAYIQACVIIFTLVTLIFTGAWWLLFLLWLEILSHKRYQDKMIGTYNDVEEWEED